MAIDEPLSVRQVIPYLALFMDANAEVAKEAERLGITHADLQMIDRDLEILEADNGNEPNQN